MKKLLTKFRLSNALDEKPDGAAPDALRREAGATAESQDFKYRAEALDRALRRPPQIPAAGAGMHESIMRAVRSVAAAPAPTRMSFGFGLATVTAGLVVAFVAVWLMAHPSIPKPSGSSRAQSLAAAQVVIDMGGEISRSVPSVMSPLTNELARVDHDIQDTTKFVLGVLPPY